MVLVYEATKVIFAVMVFAEFYGCRGEWPFAPTEG